MQEINHKKGKIYYSMGEVAEMFDVNPSLLRFWEQEFDILKPHRNKKGNRLFTPEDVDNIRIIYHLLKERKMKIEVARKQVKDFRKEVNRDAEITERLMNIRAILLEIKQDFLYDGEVIDDDTDEDDTPTPAKRTAKITKSAPETMKIEPENKPPFEEQKLFEVAVPLELLQKVEEQKADDGFESAKNAFEGIAAAENPAPEEKSRPQAIEQTLF